MGLLDKINLDKLNFLDIAKSELKAAAYVIAAGQVVKSVNRVISSAAKKTENETVSKIVDGTPGKAAINFALAAGARKLPRVGNSNPIQYLSTGLRVGSLANLGNSIVDKVLGRNKKDKVEEEV